MESGMRSLSNISGVSKRDSLPPDTPAEEFKTLEPTAGIELSTDKASAPSVEKDLQRDDSKEKINKTSESDSEPERSGSSSSSSSTSSKESKQSSVDIEE